MGSKWSAYVANSSPAHPAHDLGRLKFKARFSGKDLLAMDVGFFDTGKSDPYLQIKQGCSPVQGSPTQEVARTSTKVKDLNPLWEEQTLNLNLDGMVTVTCWDKDFFIKGDDCIGSVTVSAEQFVTDGCSLHLTNAKRQTYSGTIKVEWTFDKEAREFWKTYFHTAPKVPWKSILEAIEREFPGEYTSLLQRMENDILTTKMDRDGDGQISQMEFHAFILPDDGPEGGLKKTLNQLRELQCDHVNEKVRCSSSGARPELCV